MLADFNFNFLANNRRNWTWKALEVEKSKNPTQKVMEDDLLGLF